MIKVLETEASLDVVDSENNLVGFSLEDGCCAIGGWIISEKQAIADYEQAEQKEFDLSTYIFDVAYKPEVGFSDNGDTRSVTFRMEDWSYPGEKKPALYLHLWNTHNGYYSKGFVSKFDEVVEGTL